MTSSALQQSRANIYTSSDDFRRIFCILVRTGYIKTSTSKNATKCPLSEANTRKSEVLVLGTFNVKKFGIFQGDSRSNLPSERVKFEAGIFKEIFIDNDKKAGM